MNRTGRIHRSALITAGLFALASAAACQPSETTSAANNQGGSGNQGGDGGSGNQGGAGAQGGDGGSGAQGGGTGGTIDPCSDGATAATVYDVTKGNIGVGIKVRLDGVIAMSERLLISYSNSNKFCLWGVYVSAPKTADGQQLLETEAYSGALVLSEGGGGQNLIADKAACLTDPKANDDAIPKDIKPGDVLNVVAKKDTFLLTTCGSQQNETDIASIQMENACKVEKVGTAAVPAPHAFTADETALLAAQSKAVVTPAPGAEEFKRMWGNVKIKVTDWSPNLWPPSGGNPGGVTGPFGIIRIAPHNLQIKDNFYYKQGSAKVCETAPKFADTGVTFDHVQGFYALDFCTWVLFNDDKCADFSPQSDDCKSAGITSCFE